MVGPLIHARSEMSEAPRQDEPQQAPPPPPPDNGLRKLLTWTFIALAVTLLMAALGVSLAIRMFDPGVSP